MKIKVYIVTYNNDHILKKSLYHLYNSDLLKYEHSVFIINNYSVLDVLTEYPHVTVLDNRVRPDFSTGHLSRNWNQALINGFENLNTPSCDIVVLMQNDTFVKPSCFSDLISLHNKYAFIAVGSGDQFMSYTAEAVRTIGIWDERFCSIGYQEADYFTAAYMFYREKISINDYAHSRIYNPLYSREDWGSFLIEKDHHLNNEAMHVRKWHDYNLGIFREKWGTSPVDNWNFTGEESVIMPKIKRYCFYPYFENKIKTLFEQNYFYSEILQNID